MKWHEAVEQLFVKWGYFELSFLYDCWEVRNDTDEGMLQDEKTIKEYHGKTPREALKKACEAEGIDYDGED